MNTKLGLLATAFLVAVFAILFLIFPKKDICSDDVRGYEKTASSYLEAVRTGLEKVKASLNTEEKIKVPSQLQGLTPTSFAALKACDTQCKILAQCLRFVFTKSPAEACPIEYRDYKLRTDAAVAFLGDLEELDADTKKALSRVQERNRARDTVKELEHSSGSTGAILSRARAEAATLASDVELKLSELNKKASTLVSGD